MTDYMLNHPKVLLLIAVVLNWSIGAFNLYLFAGHLDHWWDPLLAFLNGMTGWYCIFTYRRYQSFSLERGDQNNQP